MTEEKVVGVHKTVKAKFYAAVGRRKTSVARVWLYDKGKGPVEGLFVNDKPIAEYFNNLIKDQTEALYLRPFQATNLLGKYNATIKVAGGGLNSQLTAVTHGLARALLVQDPELRPALKKEKLLTRDSRMKERKKYGHLRARRKPQWSKR